MKKTKKILALGSGSVSRPCVQYLLRRGYEVVSVDMSEKNLERTLGGHPGGVAVVADAVRDRVKLIRAHAPDVVVCLLPTAFMAQTAADCIEEGVPMVGASYVKDEVRALDARARERGAKILCEMGVDPGIDHMSAVARIREIEGEGGVVEGFSSCCGALPDLGSNTNPMGYKLSWAPASLVGASRRTARILKDGEAVTQADGKAYRHPSFVEVPGVGWFESYANADSLPYREAYGIPEARDIFRGTLRYPGWSETIVQMQKLDLFDETRRDFSDETYASLMRKIVGGTAADLEAAVASFLGVESFSLPIQKLAWLGLFEDAPVEPAEGSIRDVISRIYAEKLVFSPGEYDLVVMQHRFDVRYPASGKKKRLFSTMIDRGCVDEDTAIARTTGLPLGIGAHLMAEGRVEGTGIMIPTTPDVYIPALRELAKEGIAFLEREQAL